MKLTLTALTVAATMFASSAFAFDPADLQRLKATGNCYICDLEGAILNSAILIKANLKGADLEGASLTDARLNGADLAAANMDSANLDRADLNGANMVMTGLNNADLSGANLNGANLKSYCQIWCLKVSGHAAIWSGLVVSIPSLNVTPVMTLAR